MVWALEGLTEDTLVAWIERQTQGGAAAARGYQGQVFRYRDGGFDLAIKVAGPGPLAFLRRAMLRREARMYRRLEGFAGSPRCHGLARGRYLVLDYVEATPRYRAEIPDREAFFARLKQHIEELHRRGIAHGDLQKKDNLLVTAAGQPLILDYGIAVHRKPGFAPLNHRLWDFFARLDLNAWVKLKYRGRLEEIAEADRPHYRRNWPERLARRVKRAWRRIKAPLSRFV
jgi:predicted Ser/Thr protein kinase